MIFVSQPLTTNRKQDFPLMTITKIKSQYGVRVGCVVGVSVMSVKVIPNANKCLLICVV